jgi:multidrug efflux pump subunit AcrB
MGVMRGIKEIEDLGLFRVIGQPNLNLTVNRQKAARFQINVADVQDAVQTAVGGNALTQVLQDEQRYDLVLRYLPQFRDHQEKPSKTSACCRLRASACRWRSSAISDAGRRFGDLPRSEFSAMWRSSTACAAAIWAARWRKPSEKVERAGEAAGPAITSTGRASTNRSSARQALAIIIPLTCC